MPGVLNTHLVSEVKPARGQLPTTNNYLFTRELTVVVTIAKITIFKL